MSQGLIIFMTASRMSPIPKKEMSKFISLDRLCASLTDSSSGSIESTRALTAFHF